MKWPRSITIVRHGQSAYNELRKLKQKDKTYQQFVVAFKKDPQSEDTRVLAGQVQKMFVVGTSDYETPLTQEGRQQALKLGGRILKHAERPDVVFISPYLRTRDTFEGIRQAAGLRSDKIRIVIDDRIREQEHGLSLLYSDWRVFQVNHPEQKKLYDLQGPYWYQYPQGESVSMVRERVRSFTSMLVREYAEANVWLISHHLTKLSIRANLERLSPEEFIRIDNEEKPINCGVTIYEANPELGKDGKIELKHYNLRLY